MEQPQTRIRKRVPIRRRFLRTVLLTTIISILAASVTGLFCIRWIRGASEETLTEDLEINLKEIVHERVRAIDAKLEHFEKYIELLADSIEAMYARETELRGLGKMFYSPVDTHEYALTRGFVSSDLTEEALRDELLFFSNVESLWGPLARENQNLITTIYLGTKSGLLVSYDRYSYLSFPPEGKEMVYNYYHSEWYTRGMEKDDIFYTGVYMDSQGRGLTVTVGSSFKNSRGEKAGVVCMDFDLTAFYDQMFAAGLENGTFTFAMDHEGTVIAPDSDMLNLKEYTGLTLDQLDALKADPDGIMEINQAVYVCVPMERVGWTMCACVPKAAIQKGIRAADISIQQAVVVFIIIALLIMLIAVFAVNKSVNTIIYPLALLRRDIKTISDGNLNYRATVYRNDEIGDIASGMNEMVDRLNFTLNELMSAQQHADAMGRLATLDGLTGIYNKTAFNKQMELLTDGLNQGETQFGFVMLDLNNLKVINDNYGHEKGDSAIRNLCRIIGEVFAHSPAFRVGGDEFVVLLKNEDYRNVDALVKHFQERVRDNASNWSAKPWEHVSGAIGCALYDERLDRGVESVLSRADREMYICKKRMKN